MDDFCRLANIYEETVKIIVSGSPILANKEYVERPNQMWRAIHFYLWNYYNYTLESQKCYYTEQKKNFQKEWLHKFYFSPSSKNKDSCC